MSVIKANHIVYDVIVIGGGASGMFAAIHAGNFFKQYNINARVLILEKNDQLGKKLKITGGGRCNITNANPSFESFVSNYKDSKKFLYTPFSIFGVKDTFSFFESRGLPLVLEDEYRAFPITKKAISVFNILEKEIQDLNIEVRYNSKIEKLIFKNGSISSLIISDGSEYFAKSFILSTGGLSRPETGSEGDGFNILHSIGHNIIKPDMSLVPIVSKDTQIQSLSGLSFNSIRFKVILDNKIILKKQGKVLFTDFGLSGPAILNVSKIIKDNLPLGNIKISFDLVADINTDQMDLFLLDLIKNNNLKKIKNINTFDLSDSLWLIVLQKSEIDPDTMCAVLTKKQRLALSNTLKSFTISIYDTLGYEKSIVSSGGVDLKEINFKTMRSLIYDNLYITGDLLNIDRPSGGFSLQLCWTTGAIAGQSSAQNI